MILGFKTHLNGQPTGFIPKILTHLGEEAMAAYLKKLTLEHAVKLNVDLSNEPLDSAMKYYGKELMACDFAPKKLTIRDDPNNRWQKGRLIHFATGARTKKYECFAMGECKEIASIWITLYKNGSYCITIDQDNLSYAKVSQLAFDDGFKTLSEFLKFHTGTSIDPEQYWDHPIADHPQRMIRKKIIYF